MCLYRYGIGQLSAVRGEVRVFHLPGRVHRPSLDPVWAQLLQHMYQQVLGQQGHLPVPDVQPEILHKT